MNSSVSPSQRVLSLYPSVFWISDTYQMEDISHSVESIVIRGNVGCRSEQFTLSNLPSLMSLELGCYSFEQCERIVLDSMSD